MARSHARITTSIWHDEDWRTLSPMGQWAYELILTQSGLSMCGVLSYTPKRWLRFAAGLTVRKIERAVNELRVKRFVIVDDETEELLVRTFARNDGVLKSRNLIIAMWRAAADVVSDQLREAFVEGLPEGFREHLADAFPQGLPEGLAKPLGEPSLAHAHAGVRARPLPPPLTHPTPPVAANGSPTESTPMEPDQGGGRSKHNPTTVAACVRLAKGEREVEEAKGKPIRHVEAWERAKLDKLLAEHGDRGDELVAADPKLTASRLAGVLTNAGYARAYLEDRERAAAEVDG